MKNNSLMISVTYDSNSQAAPGPTGPASNGGEHAPGDVGGPVDPAAPLPRPREDIAKRRPEAGRADAGLRRLLQAPFPEVTERAAPAVRVPAEPVHDGGDVLFAIPVGPGHRGHAPAAAVRTGREAAPVHPYVDEALPA